MKKSLWERSYSPVNFPVSPLQLKPEDRWFLSGSCFAGSLQHYLSDHFLLNQFSPLGISYNPLSIARGLDLLTGREQWNPEEIFFHQGLWKHHLFHGERNHPDKEIYRQTLAGDLQTAADALKNSRLLVLTLGTAWVYRRKDNGKIVNNCHRLEADSFDRSILGIEEMKGALEESLDYLKKENPSIEIVLTVSPVRHLRDDPRQNSLSKARLICVTQELALQREDCHYFPSWEIMMDELRDYRWYAENMKNPSAEALSYIMERFMEWAASEPLKHYIKDSEKLFRRMQHRISGLSQPREKSFIEATEAMKKEMLQRYPHLRSLL